jgi:hypothetical protein
MSQSNIYPKDCPYGCNTRIYWNTAVNEYWEVPAQKKHVCPNRTNNKVAYSAPSSTTTYYSKKPGVLNQKCLNPLSSCRVVLQVYRDSRHRIFIYINFIF